MNQFRKVLIIYLFIFYLTSDVLAQTGIGTTTPHASAKLDVSSSNKGFLPPRVTLTSATDASTISSPAEGLLVYNLGSSGLQAGYYYWNGANWATIATATSAGNGVTANNLTKLYHELFSTDAGKAASTGGYSFTVPVSGRYEFNFNSTGWNTNGDIKLTFNVREGTTILASDYHQSKSSNIYAEYEGRLEVNLNAGTTYNIQVVTTTGSRWTCCDWDKVFYKLVAGNLPVTGQTVEYGIARYTGSDGAALSAGSIVAFDATASGNLTWSSNKFSLKANKTYIIESSLAIYAVNPSAGRFQIYDYTNSRSLANGLFMSHGGSGTNYPNANTPMKCLITPSSDIEVGIRLEGNYGTAPGIIGSASTVGVFGSSNVSYFIVQQIGSSAIINPWVLSGNDVYNTTGKVGVGNNSPLSTLDVTGSLAVSGATNLKNTLNVGTGVGFEGGEIDLVTAASGNTNLTNGTVAIDVYGDKLRIFENGGNTRGVYVDLGKAPNSVGGELMMKASGLVNRGVDVTLGNLKARIAATGNVSLQLSTISGTYSIYGSSVYSQSGVIGITIDGSAPRTISTTPTYLVAGNNFGTSGSTDTWILMDTSNSIAWRITMVLGASYNNNLITIERLL